MDATDIPALPFVDEQTRLIEASADAVWNELDTVMAGARGFRVAVSVPGRELALVGRHPFSTYALIFHLDDTAQGHTRLRAETRARFPGRAGALYRLLVMGTSGHVLVVRRMLNKVRDRALRDQPPPTRSRRTT